MGEAYPPTAADWANHNAQDALRKARTLEARVADLERRLAALENPPCCKGGPQWGHTFECPQCPE